MQGWDADKTISCRNPANSEELKAEVLDQPEFCPSNRYPSGESAPKIDRYLSIIKIMIAEEYFLLTNNEIFIYCNHASETAFHPNRA
jgi:hypothetical protein